MYQDYRKAATVCWEHVQVPWHKILTTIALIPSWSLHFEVLSWRRVWWTSRVQRLLVTGVVVGLWPLIIEVGIGSKESRRKVGLGAVVTRKSRQLLTLEIEFDFMPWSNGFYFSQLAHCELSHLEELFYLACRERESTAQGRQRLMEKSYAIRVQK